MNAIWMISMIFAVIASMIAHSKGRNSLGWFAAGLLIGPFSMIVAFLSPEAKAGQYTKCPACQEIIRIQAKKCHYCGTEQLLGQ